MEKTLVALLATWIFGVACTPQALPTPETSVVRQTYDIPCDEAHRVAAKAIRVRGMKVTHVVRGPSGGEIRGADDKENLLINLSCGAGGVSVSASGGHWMEQGVRMSFQNFVERGDRIWPAPRGPKILVEAFPGVEAKLWFPSELEGLGMTAFRLRAINGGSRAIRIDPSRIRGGRSRAIAPDTVRTKLGSSVDGRLFPRATLAQGEEVRGFVFLPPGAYESLTVTVVDVETGEGDDFQIFVK